MFVDEDYQREQIENPEIRGRYVALLLAGITEMLAKHCAMRNSTQWLVGYTGLSAERLASLTEDNNPNTVELEAWKIQAAYSGLAGWISNYRADVIGSRLYMFDEGDPFSDEIVEWVDEVAEMTESTGEELMWSMPAMNVQLPFVSDRSVNDKYDRYRELVVQLVPGAGCAETLQGELVRALWRLHDEHFRNGNMNFDYGVDEVLKDKDGEWPPTPHSRGYFGFVYMLRQHLPEHKELVNAYWPRGVTRDSGPDPDEVFKTLAGAVADWVDRHPDPILYDAASYSA